ncbi:MAG: DNA polymerase III subunit delta [Oscillospiraceae bacterium]
MINLTDNTIKNSLKSDGLQRLYLVAGNDEFLVDACIAMVIRSAVGTDRNAILRYDAQKEDGATFEEIFSNYSLMGNTRVLLLENFSVGSFTQERLGLFESLFADVPCDLVVVARQVSDDKRFSVSKKASLLAAVCSKSAVVAVTSKSGGELFRYVKQLADKNKCDIDDKAVSEIIARCGDDLLTINNEMTKLSALCNYKTIVTDDVKKLCIRTPDAGVYDMINAIERSNTRQALATLTDMLSENMDPYLIAASLETAFVNTYRARLAKEKGLGEKYLFDNFDYKKGDRKVSIALEKCSKYSIKTVESIICLLFELDVRMKSSAIDKKCVLEEYVVRIAAAVGDRR